MSLVKKTFCGLVRSVNSEKFTVDCVMSDETLDRYDEVIEVEAYRKTLKEFKKHAVLLSSHRYGGDLRSQIGEWEKIWIEGKQLIGRAKYYVGEGNPEADWGFKLAEKGIAAYSVGFIPIKAETLDWDKYEEAKKKGKKVARRIYKEVELLETSQVIIPANPSALQRSIDAGDDTKDAAQYYLDNLDQLKDFSDIEIIESDVAEKFLIKDPSASEEENIVVVGESESIPCECLNCGHKTAEFFVECPECGGKMLQERSTGFTDEDIEVFKTELENKIWEETTGEIRFRVKDPAQFKKFRRFTMKKDKPRVFAIYGQLKKGDSKWAVQALRFPKGDGWTMEEAKKWVKENPVKLFEGYTEESFSELRAYEEDPFEGIEKGFDAVKELLGKLTNSVDKLNSDIEAIATKMEDILSAVSVKTVVPNDSYIENVLSDGLVDEEPDNTTVVAGVGEAKAEEVDTETLKTLKDSLSALTDSIKKFTGGEK